MPYLLHVAKKVQTIIRKILRESFTENRLRLGPPERMVYRLGRCRRKRGLFIYFAEFRLFADTIFNSRRETRAPLVDNIAHARAEFIEVQAHRGCKFSIDTLLLVLELLLDVRCQVLLVLKSEQLYMPFLLR